MDKNIMTEVRRTWGLYLEKCFRKHGVMNCCFVLRWGTDSLSLCKHSHTSCKLVRSPRENGGGQDPKKIFTQELEGTRRRGRPRRRWKVEAERDLQVLGVRRWRELVADRKKLKDIVRQAKAHSGLQCQWKKNNNNSQTSCIHLEPYNLHRRLRSGYEKIHKLLLRVCQLPEITTNYDFSFYQVSQQILHRPGLLSHTATKIIY